MKRIVKMSFQEKADQGFRVMKGKGNQATSQRERLKVAAYCRVSTLQESQESSIEGQYRHYEQLIKSNSDWEFAGIYLEVGVTGTKAEVRPELQRLMEDCKRGRILDGQGMFSIAGELNRSGVPTRYGGAWQPSTIRNIVYNPFYVGDVLYQKTFVDQTFRQRRNRGEMDQYYERGHHRGIIDRESYECAHRAIQQRGRECGTYSAKENPEQAAKRQRRYGFSGRLVCGECGAILHRQKYRYYALYVCANHQRKSYLCPAMPEMEDSIKNAFLTCLNKLSYSQSLLPSERMLDTYIRNVSDPKREKAKELKTFISRWKIGRKTDDFSEKEFGKWIEKAVIRAGNEVVFYFDCGLILTESLRRREL